ncbi:hypothetical protein CYR40_16080 [Chimaeribacter arupi]|uniref:YD repeat-containing protein n=2 Tax=Yersiniaceae TaxID=1903411 RepID=A0A2N5EM95_9GAMM|nr:MULTISPECIES: RHS repeat protein [Yersiniaceae]MBS0969599.1 RHS repeat protein [Nissabacter archeti]MDV5142338.1 RHS repeat protein [Chimaeribacter arupi]PLR35284.1 hypothetical protein CYR23_08930 [Chimaeribacter arupi]PLR44080.1 hypothetical protein CYR40_16080 [Chimaeribacter arupi]PLR48491.1 hypothetical protein CYR52_13240 [Chimaeribacter arupi]
MGTVLKALTGIVLAAGAIGSATAAPLPCAVKNRQVNESNIQILLGGSARGDIRQFVSGSLGKDVNQQVHLSGNIDRCGRLSEAVFKYQKTENNLRLEMVSRTLRVEAGWITDYEVRISVLKEANQTLVNRKRGTLYYTTGKRGNITASTDLFTINDRRGFTTGTYDYDAQLRVVRSVTRGTDALSNQETRYRYTPQGWLLSATATDGDRSTYRYDPQGRESGSVTFSSSPFSQTSRVERCQSWDEAGNCTLSDTFETELLPSMRLTRNLGTAYQYRYWDEPPVTGGQLPVQ